MALLDYGPKYKDKASGLKDAGVKTLVGLVVGIGAAAGWLYYSAMHSPIKMSDFELAELINQEDREKRQEFAHDPNDFHDTLFKRAPHEMIVYVLHNPYKDHSYIKSAIWHESKIMDDGYNRPCIDVKIEYVSGEDKTYKAVPIKGRFGAKEMCLEWNREAQWGFENGEEKKFLEDHDYKWSNRRKVEATDGDF